MAKLILFLLFVSFQCLSKEIRLMNPEEKTVHVWNELRKDKLAILDNYYAKDLVFEDPFGAESRGLML